MAQQAGTGKSRGRARCCLPQEPCQAFAGVKVVSSSLLPLRLNGCPMMPLLHVTSFLTQIYSQPASVHFALSLKTRSPTLLRDTRQSDPPCQVKQAKHVLDSCSVPLLSFATTPVRKMLSGTPRAGHLSPQCRSKHHPAQGYAPARHRSHPKARSPTRKGDGQLTRSLQAAGLHSELTPSKGELGLLEAVDRTPRVPQTRLLSRSLPAQLPLLPEHSQATPAPSLHPGRLRWLTKRRHGQDRSPKATAATAAAETGPAAASPRGGDRGARRRALSTGPKTPPHRPQLCAPAAPTATTSKEKPSESNLLMNLQFLLEEQQQKPRL